MNSKDSTYGWIKIPTTIVRHYPCVNISLRMSWNWILSFPHLHSHYIQPSSTHISFTSSTACSHRRAFIKLTRIADWYYCKDHPFLLLIWNHAFHIAVERGESCMCLTDEKHGFLPAHVFRHHAQLTNRNHWWSIRGKHMVNACIACYQAGF